MSICEVCGVPSAVHLTEIRDGRQSSRHFCKEHADEYLGEGTLAGMMSPYAMTSLSQVVLERMCQYVQDADLSVDNPKGARNRDRAVSAFARMLADEAPELRCMAAEWLGGLADNAAPALPALQSASTDEFGYVSAAAKRALSRIRASLDVPPASS
jgi:HEAT repeats